jgi:Mn2+/Fe2+ NRAMP family transporter
VLLSGQNSATPPKACFSTNAAAAAAATAALAAAALAAATAFGSAVGYHVKEAVELFDDNILNHWARRRCERTW